jgi:hypothetical protein
MVKIFLMLLCAFVVFGCSDGNKPKTITAPPGADEAATAVTVAAPVETEMNAQADEGRRQVEAEMAKAFKPAQTPVAAAGSSTAVITPQSTAVSTGSNDDIIAQNQWGFSVYDPQAQVTTYYSSNGVVLGQRQT